MQNMDISGLGTDFMDMMKNMEKFSDMSNNFNDLSNNFKDISSNAKKYSKPRRFARPF